MGIVARTVATEVRPAAQLVAENRSAQVTLGTGRADIISPGNLRARYPNQRRQAIILRLSGVVRLEGRSRTKRPRLAGCNGRGRWRRVFSNAHFRQIIPAAIVTGVDRIRCSVTQIFRYSLKWVAGSSCRWGPLTPVSTSRSSKKSPLGRRQRAPSPSSALCPLRVHKIKSR